ncbi:MAG: AMP-binding protein [Alphaproteobacteria bacterium]|jgi:crotonobetaine/carnitine-CoA ligase|nr:AMP-binding protein [Alphaproteobacteria bacterium]MDP6815132.1 AMP-binding protein [Alphaproteobacteria bacterium]
MSEFEFTTVHEVFGRATERWPDNGAVCATPMPGRAYHPDGVEFSYARAWPRIEALRRRYAAAGYGHGHRVALLLEQRPEFFLHFLALNSLGCGIVPINPDYRHDEMLYQMDHSEADLAVVIESRLEDLLRVAADRRKPLPVVPFDTLPDDLPNPGPAPRDGPAGIESECSLLYTSGTTGRPKGCILSNGYYINAGRWYLSMGGRLNFGEGERILNPLPFFHMNAQAVCATALFLSGGCLIAPDRFHPGRWWADVVATRASAIHYLGVVPPLLMNQPETPEEKQHQLRFGVGAGIEPELHGAFEERFGFPLVEVWGMTETGRMIADCHEPRRIDSRAFGIPEPGLEARVVDDDDNDVASGGEGELLVRHTAAEPRKWFFAGYLKNEEETEAAWRGGWFHTGDTVRQGDDGMLYFVDRKKNIIRRSGENIAAAEIEACLQAHPGVAQVAVIGAPDEIRDEEVLACIVAMPDAADDDGQARALFDWCFERLAYYKAPGWLLFVDSLPTTGTQKVQKAQIFPDEEDPRQSPNIHDFRDLKKRQR